MFTQQRYSKFNTKPGSFVPHSPEAARLGKASVSSSLVPTLRERQTAFFPNSGHWPLPGAQDTAVAGYPHQPANPVPSSPVDTQVTFFEGSTIHSTSTTSTMQTASVL